jgi:DNA-binding transcriptional MerR regulator
MTLMPIGEFARLARLTVKAVRHYAAEGLLVLASVDPHSGYRYYSAAQVRTATTIALLRSLDVPLPVVREVLAATDPDAVAAVLARQRERLAAELARREQMLRSLDALLLAPERVSYDVSVVQRGPVRLAGTSGRVRATALDEDTSALCRAPSTRGRRPAASRWSRCTRSTSPTSSTWWSGFRRPRAKRCCGAARGRPRCTSVRTPGCRWPTQRYWSTSACTATRRPGR